MAVRCSLIGRILSVPVASREKGLLALFQDYAAFFVALYHINILVERHLEALIDCFHFAMPAGRNRQEST